ncbi:unnamed protein product, partial [marine sediment metagenome]
HILENIKIYQEQKKQFLVNIKNKVKQYNKNLEFHQTIIIWGGFFLYHIDLLIKEIKKIIESQNIINSFFENTLLTINILICDTDPDLFIFSLNYFDYQELFEKTQIAKKININLYFLFPQTINKMHSIFFNIFNPLYIKKINYFFHPNFFKIRDKKSTSKLQTELDAKIKEIAFNFKTIAFSGKLWYKNLLLNIKNISEFNKNNIKRKKYFSLYKLKNNIKTERKALLIGASPLLEKNIQRIIKEKRNKNTYLFVIDNAARLLSSYNIKPDFIIILDSRNFIKQFIPHIFENVPRIIPITV